MQNLNLEKGVFNTFLELTITDGNIVWNPDGKIFYLTCGYRIQCDGKNAGAYDSYDQKFFLTDEHINKLFAIAKRKQTTKISRLWNWFFTRGR